MKYAIILAAGNQTRFKSNIPKGIYALNENINAYKGKVDKIFVMCSFSNVVFFSKFKNPHFEIVPIKSGYGCGEATLTSLLELPIKGSDTIFLSWGDSIQSSKVIETCLENYDGSFLMPVVVEEDPYVKIETQDKKITSILFSKLGDDTSGLGYHDMSLFLFKKRDVVSALKKLIKVTRFKYEKGQELSFLDIFNYHLIDGNIIEIDFEKARSFNTVEELDIVQNN